jgi:dipicolinate synthase subunit A
MTMKIENYGASQRCAEALRLLSEWASEWPNELGVILLPIPTTRDGIHITGSTLTIHEVLSEVRRGDVVVGYSIPKDASEYIISRGGRVCDVSGDEEFLDENAFISAVGTLEYLLSVSNSAPQDMHAGIIGYGRIGRHLARILLFLGAKIRIYTSKNATRVALGGLGVETRELDYNAPSLDDIEDLDVLINTAPSPLSACFKEKKVPVGTCVIDVASGNNFEGVEGVVRLPSIPEKNYPKSAGRVYFHAIQRYMREVI